MRAQESQPNQREAVILQILLNGERYGLEIRNEFHKRTRRDLPLGSLYPTLDVMIDKGFIRARRGESEHQHGGNCRRYYQISAAGVRALESAQPFAAAILGKLTWHPTISH